MTISFNNSPVRGEDSYLAGCSTGDTLPASDVIPKVQSISDKSQLDKSSIRPELTRTRSDKTLTQVHSEENPPLLRRSNSTKSIYRHTIISRTKSSLDVTVEPKDEAASKSQRRRSLTRSGSIKNIGNLLRPRAVTAPEPQMSTSIASSSRRVSRKKHRSLSPPNRTTPANREKSRSRSKNPRMLSLLFGHNQEVIYPLNHSLEEIGDVPLIVQACIDALTKLKAWESAGIFREQALEKEVLAAMNNFQYIGRDAIDTIEDVDLVAVILKRYLRDNLPGSLIPYDMQAEILDCINDDDVVDIDKLQCSILINLPEANRQTLFHLICLLSTIASRSEERTATHTTPSLGRNFMNAENLAIVFQPTIFKFPEGTPSMRMIGKEATQRKEIVKVMIENYATIFARRPLYRIDQSLSLSDLPTNLGSHCPQVVDDCMRRLVDLQAYKAHGIGRIAGASPRVRKMLELYQAGNRQAVLSAVSANDTIDVLKTTLRTTRDWVIPDDVKEAFLNLNINNPEHFAQFIENLPPRNRQILQRVIFFFKLVKENEATTKMTASNCAICFTQNLINIGPPVDAPHESVAQVMKLVGEQTNSANEKIEFMINNFDKLFLPQLP